MRCLGDEICMRQVVASPSENRDCIFLPQCSKRLVQKYSFPGEDEFLNARKCFSRYERRGCLLALFSVSFSQHAE